MSEENSFVPIEISEIKKRIPHRYPMLMIDRITHVDIEKQEAIGVKSVSGNEPFFEGHFPDKPIMPGVLTVEAMAQVSAVWVTEALPELAGKLVFFMSIEKARFRRPVVPGDRLELHIKLQKNKGAVYRFEGKGKVDGKVVAEAEFTAMIADPPKD